MFAVVYKSVKEMSKFEKYVYTGNYQISYTVVHKAYLANFVSSNATLKLKTLFKGW